MLRAAELILKTPICVLFMMSLIAVIYYWQTIQHHELDLNFTLCPQAIIFQNQIHRMITYPFIHGSIIHFVANMMSILSLGSFLELSFGTLWHLSTIICSMVLVSSTYLLIAFILYTGGIRDVMNENALGLSGTTFHLLVIQCHLKASSSQSLYGLFQVSSKVYPWVLLVATQIIIPYASFEFHLSGILIGHLHTAGLLNYILPSIQDLRFLDNSDILIHISSRGNYIKTPLSDDIFKASFSPSSKERRKMFCSAVSVGLKFFKDVAETLEVILFGREQSELNEVQSPSLLVESNSDDTCTENETSEVIITGREEGELNEVQSPSLLVESNSDDECTEDDDTAPQKLHGVDLEPDGSEYV